MKIKLMTKEEYRCFYFKVSSGNVYRVENQVGLLTKTSLETWMWP